MGNNIIDSTNPGIVATEVQVNLSDEKLKSTLLHIYEEAQKNERTIQYYDWCSVLLSIAGTLLLSLVTSDFHGVGSIDANTVRIVAWVVFTISGILGFIFLYIKYTKKVNGDTTARDKAVEKVMNDHFIQKDRETKK